MQVGAARGCDRRDRRRRGCACVRADEPKEPVIVTPPTTTDTDIQPAITARLELDATTVEQGGTIDGHLVVENNTERPFRFGDRCGSQFAVVLRNASVPNEDVVFDGMCTAGTRRSSSAAR